MEKTTRELEYKHNINGLNLKIGLVFITVVLVADQITKFWIINLIPIGFNLELLPILSFFLVYNTGISFSMLSEVDKVFLISMSVCVIFIVAWFGFRNAKTILSSAAYGAILGGAIGNVLDRILHGAVIDFIFFHYGTWSFAIFNLADSAISLGVIALFIDTCFISKNRTHSNV